MITLVPHCKGSWENRPLLSTSKKCYGGLGTIGLEMVSNHLYDLKNVENTHGGVSLIAELQA